MEEDNNKSNTDLLQHATYNTLLLQKEHLIIRSIAAVLAEALKCDWGSTSRSQLVSHI